MADDNTLRSYRSNDPYRRDAGPLDAKDAGAGTDPLAELARLIGQTDPFADSARNNAPGTEQHAAPASDWRQHIERPAYQTMRDEQPMPADPLGDYQDDPRYAPVSGYDDRSYQPAEPVHDGYADHPAAAMAPGPAGSSGEEFYDDPPHRHTSEGRRGGWFATTALLVGCAVFGTVGAYGYRTYAKPSSSPKAAPVIIADSSPSKILPAAADPKSTRSQERLPAQGGNERLVSREEQPVALASGGGSPPRVVFPSPVQPAPSASPPPAAAAAPPTPPAASAPAPSPAPAAATPAAASTEPKRVRTVTIRNERPDASGRPVTTSQSAREQAAPPPSRGARTAPRAEPTSRGEPLSLDPAAQAQAREPVRPQQRAALTPPAPRESAPPPSARPTWEPAPRETAPAPRETAPNGPRLASAPANGSNGGYVVQVSSQRSQADAQASYRGLQKKYPQLKSRQATIRRADLGSKGVYYRAMVGPFGSAGEAGQFCNSLKQAGGQCIILRN